MKPLNELAEISISGVDVSSLILRRGCFLGLDKGELTDVSYVPRPVSTWALRLTRLASGTSDSKGAVFSRTSTPDHPKE